MSIANLASQRYKLSTSQARSPFPVATLAKGFADHGDLFSSFTHCDSGHRKSLLGVSSWHLRREP